jgi:hypothetical protein
MSIAQVGRRAWWGTIISLVWMFVCVNAFLTSPRHQFCKSSALNQFHGRSKYPPTKTVLPPIFMVGAGDNSPADTPNKAETSKTPSHNEKLLGSRRLAAAREVIFLCILNVTGTLSAVRLYVFVVMYQ